MLCWWVFDASKPKLAEFNRRMTAKHPSTLRFLPWYAQKRQTFDTMSSRLINTCRNCVQNQLSRVTSQPFADAADRKLKAFWVSWQEKSAPQRMDRLFFKPVECFNFIWLAYITLAQTTGAYNNCKCKSSIWAGGGG
jgi:hypothetical protein